MSNTRDRHLGALALRPRHLELQDPGHGPRVGQAGQRVRVCHALEPLGALGGHRGSPEGRDRRRREVRHRDEQRLLGGVRPRARPASRSVSTPTHASTPPLPRPRAAGRRRSSWRRPASRRCGRASRSGPARRGGSGAPGWTTRRPRTPRRASSAMPRVSSSSSAAAVRVLGEDRGRGGADRGRARLDDDRRAPCPGRPARASAAAPADSTVSGPLPAPRSCPPRVPPRACRRPSPSRTSGQRSRVPRRRVRIATPPSRAADAARWARRAASGRGLCSAR